MITIFNRKELTIVNSTKKQVKIRECLDSHDIKYSLKVVYMYAQLSSRGHIGSFGQTMDSAYMYTFYVHKDDFDAAQAILAGRL